MFKNRRIVQFLSGLLLLCIVLSGCNIAQISESTWQSEAGAELSSSERTTFSESEIATQKQTEKVTEPNGEDDPSNDLLEKPSDDADNKDDGTDNVTDNNDNTDDKDNKDDNTDNKDDDTDIDYGDDLVIPAEPPKPASDPYANVNKTEFYSDYEPATGYWDAYYRTQHGLMSGSIEEQDQEPTLADNMPMLNGYYIRNTSALYSKDGNVYYVVDDEGDIVNRIYKGAAYVTLEEVAAYVFAFGDVPANYSSSKNTKPTSSIWGEYLRLNHSAFSGDTSRYPYEPELPDISGCGGDLRYYEIDIGTTGTDCDPSYYPAIYNNGTKITRGAARIVYTRYDKNGDNIIDVNEKYLFYTYNHYNDFQEYLNYEGGWGEMFGNITGGGSISSKYDCNPTEYVPTVRLAFVESYTYESVTLCIVDIYYLDKRNFAFAA